MKQKMSQMLSRGEHVSLVSLVHDREDEEFPAQMMVSLSRASKTQGENNGTLLSLLSLPFGGQGTSIALISCCIAK